MPVLRALLPKFIFAVAACIIVATASAQERQFDSGFVATGQARTRVIAEAPFVPGQVNWFALDQKLAENWHVYWKNPGDSGLPLVMEWTLPDGFAAGDISYPYPERIPLGPLVNFGYHHDPVFLIPITVPDNAVAGTDIEVEVFATWLICEDVCIPEEANFSLSVPVVTESTNAAPFGDVFEKARAALPSQLSGTAAFGVGNNQIILEVTPDSKAFATNTIIDPFFFAQVEGLVTAAAAQPAQFKDGALRLQLTPDFAFDGATLDEVIGVLTYQDADGNHQAFEVMASLDPSIKPSAVIKGASKVAPSSVGQSGVISLPILLAMAFFGGIILNVMPCVFPILFIKASSLMSAAHTDQRTIRAHGWLYTGGVVATFAAMGALLLVLRAQGEQLGWGFHLQSPIIVLLSAYTLFLVGLNLAGVFHVGTSLQGVGQGLAEKRGGLGAFFTGMLAVVVAAPCIGPLLSAPMGAAVFLPPIWGMMIFILMALGLAAPYLLISLVPSLGQMLPKPGAWMETFKQFLSFPVFAAAAYFLWVLSAQTGTTGLAIGFVGLLLLAVSAWLFEQTKNGKWQIAGGIAALLLLVGALFPLPTLKPITALASANEGGTHGAIISEAFNPSRITELNQGGTDVFVDFTAAWCVTCQFNKLTVFSSEKLAETFARSGTVFMVADWTVRDPLITQALEDFGRSGVPLYVYYPAGNAPQILPLPLTENAVIKAISDL